MRTEDSSYHRVSKLLHWLMALCILGMIALGYFMEDFKPVSFRIDAYQFHKSLGITLLALTLFRIVWRLTHRPPALPATMKPIEKLGANVSHIGFYVLMLAMPLSGWIMVSASGKYPTIFFWLFNMPHLPMPEGVDVKALRKLAYEIHEITTTWLALGLLSVHVVAALKHHYIDRDTVLVRMLPRFLAVKLRR
jgi:cytochrome b561